MEKVQVAGEHVDNATGGVRRLISKTLIQHRCAPSRRHYNTYSILHEGNIEAYSNDNIITYGVRIASPHDYPHPLTAPTLAFTPTHYLSILCVLHIPIEHIEYLVISNDMTYTDMCLGAYRILNHLLK